MIICGAPSTSLGGLRTGGIHFHQKRRFGFGDDRCMNHFFGVSNTKSKTGAICAGQPNVAASSGHLACARQRLRRD
jgi:hypothetical protein